MTTTKYKASLVNCQWQPLHLNPKKKAKIEEGFSFFSSFIVHETIHPYFDVGSLETMIIKALKRNKTEKFHSLTARLIMTFTFLVDFFTTYYFNSPFKMVPSKWSQIDSLNQF